MKQKGVKDLVSAAVRVQRIIEIINHNAEESDEDVSVEDLDSQISDMSTLVQVLDVEGKPDLWDSNPDFEKPMSC